MKKLFPVLLFSLALFLFLPGKIFAADLTVNCNNDGCSPASSASIFPSDYWYPGRFISRQIGVNNTGAVALAVSNQSQNSRASGNLDAVMLFSIVRNSNSSVLWSGTLRDFYNTGSVSLGTLAAAGSEAYNYTVTMDSNSGDQHQGKNTSYDLVLTFSGGPGGGGGGGGGSAPPVCSDVKPGSAPVLTSAVAGTNSVTLFWDQAADPVTYYLVTYGTSPGPQTYGNPNVGGKGTGSYTITNLSGGTTYYFRVRAGNGCMPGDFSNELSTTPSGGLVTGVAVGFVPGVLGEATPAAQASLSGEVKGETTSNPVSPKSSNFLWLWIFLPLLLLSAVFFYLKKDSTVRP